MIPWTPVEAGLVILIYAAYLLTFMYLFPKVKRWKPHWEGRAELFIMVPGLLMLILLVLLVTL